MTDATQAQGDLDVTGEEQGMMSRRQLLRAAAAGAALAALPAVTAQADGFTFPFFPQITSGTYTTETIQQILDAVVTPHYLAATGATTTLANAAGLGLTGWQLSMQQAAAAREHYHIDFLTSLGASPLVTAFTFPPASSARERSFWRWPWGLPRS